MAKIDWELVNEQFQTDQQITGITMQAWCEQNGYKYQTARRYLKCHSQLPSGSETFHVATQDGPLIDVKTAQIAQKTAQETNAQKTAQKTAQSAEEPEQARDEGDLTSYTDTDLVEADFVKYKGHDANGRFKKGEYQGNPHPAHKFPERHRYSTKHGGYSKFFPSGKFNDARELRLRDELLLARTQLISLAEKMQEIENSLILAGDDLDLKSSLYRQHIDAQKLVDQRMARIESLTRTLSNLQIDKVNKPRIQAETKRLTAVTKKAEIESRVMERNEGGNVTPIDDIIDEIQSMDSGLMSGLEIDSGG